MRDLLARLRWTKNRLAAMSAPEILYRFSEAALRRYDRTRARPFIAPLRDYGDLPALPGLRENLAHWSIPEDLIQQWAEDARVAQSAAFSFFGQQWPACPPHTLWHLDPKTGTFWPRDLFCFAIDYRHAPDSDIKFTWELNRLHYLQPVAALAFKTQDAALATFCLAQIESWIDNNPPFLGINWNSGIELALRLVSILTVTTLTGAYLSRKTRAKIWSTLHTHARWIARYPSLYSSANNHRTVEGLGLFLVGTLCPHFAEAGQWKKTGWQILCDAAQRQILPDGCGAEQAVAYAASVLETLLTGYKVAQAHNIPIPAYYARKLAEGGAYLRWLTDAQGGMPHIGDDDNACVFGAYHNGDRYPASILAAVAAVTNRPDLTPPGIQPHLRQAIFGFAPPPDFAPYGTRCFPYGGMTIGRHQHPQGDILLAFDHGPLGYLSIAAHGHADALSLWLHKGDQPIFVDAGTYLYHADHDQRRAFRSTAAHNTLTLADQDSSRMSGNFNWSRKATVTLRSFTTQGDFWQAEAEHDGYAEKFHTLHRRTLNVSPASGAVIEDLLTGDAPHQVSINFLLHPALTARREGRDIAILKGEILLLRMRHEGNLETIIGAPDTPDGGWYSPSFGLKYPTTRLSFRGTLPPNQKTLTHIFWSS